MPATNPATAPQNQAERLAQLREQSGKSVREVAEEIRNLRNFTQISLYERKPDVRLAKDVLEALARVYKTSPEYIKHGTKPKPLPPFNLMPPRIIVTDNLAKERILRVPIKARAGYLQSYTDPEYLGELKAYSIPGFEHGTHRIFELSGDSMAPDFKEGDEVICEHVESPGDIKDGWPHVIVTTEGVCFKRVTNQANRGFLIIESDNKSYKTDVIPVGEVRELWAYRRKLTT